MSDDVANMLRAWAINLAEAHRIVGFGEDLRSAADEIERLRLENEHLRAAIASDLSSARKRAQQAHVERLDIRAELSAERERYDKLREALKPFAKAADNFDGMPIKNPEEWFAYSGSESHTERSGSITIGDLRRAREALKDEGVE